MYVRVYYNTTKIFFRLPSKSLIFDQLVGDHFVIN